MRSLPYSLQFRGYAEDLEARDLCIRATSPGCCFVTTGAEGGLSGRFELLESEDAVLESRVALAADDSFDADYCPAPPVLVTNHERPSAADRKRGATPCSYKDSPF